MLWLKGPRLPLRTLQSPLRRFQSNGSGAPVLTEESELAHLRDAVRTQSFAHPEAKEDLSLAMREKLTQEFDAFLGDFVRDVDPSLRSAEHLAERLSGSESSTFGDMYEPSSAGIQQARAKNRMKFSSVRSTGEGVPYSTPEMYVRQLFHARRVAQLGAEIAPRSVYKPADDLHHPKSIQETGISTLLAAGAHLGHATRGVRANCLPYIYGVRDGIHIIDLQQTLSSLKRVARVAQEISRKGGLVLYVSTNEDQRRTVEKAAERSHGYYVSGRWAPGTFTNYQIMTENKPGARRLEVDMADKPTNRDLSASLVNTIIKPDIVVVMNAVENRSLLYECLRMRIPATGIVDTDSEPSLLTYPVPGNDDSLRFGDLFAGVLSRAAERGRAQRHSEFTDVQKAKELLRQGEAFTVDEPRPSEISDAERELMK